MGTSVNKTSLALKFIALLSIVRWYNILLTVFAQYLSAYVLLDHYGMSIWEMLKDLKLHAIVLASVCSIAGGSIINNFYDFEKDLINRPNATLFNGMVSRQTTLNCYLLFNTIAILVAFSASLKIGIFFLIFIVALWIYSHKVQRLPFIKEFAASILSITCFFAVLLHYSVFYPFVFIYGAFFMSLVYCRELVKQFINFTGDKALNIQSLPVSLGIDKAKSFTMFIMVLSFLAGLSILFYYGIEQRNYFILLAISAILACMFLLQRNSFNTVNTIYKIIIILGILNLLWVKISG
jgi:4-hydroxybenzoate polyprenyltransferase